MRKRTTLGVLVLLLLAPLADARAESDGTGFYGRAGVAFGWGNIDVPLIGSNVSNGVNVGFNVAAGYRVNPLFAVEGDFAFVTGGDVSALGNTLPNVETQAIAFTVDAKLYPFGFRAEDANSLVQPYLRVGVGGGSGGLKNAGALSGSQGTFLGRFGAGVDVMLNERFGLYGDASYYVNTKEVLVGVGALSFGGIVRFH